MFASFTPSAHMAHPHLLGSVRAVASSQGEEPRRRDHDSPHGVDERLLPGVLLPTSLTHPSENMTHQRERGAYKCPRGEVGAEHQGRPGSRHPVGPGMRPPGWRGRSGPGREPCGQSNLCTLRL